MSALTLSMWFIFWDWLKWDLLVGIWLRLLQFLIIYFIMLCLFVLVSFCWWSLLSDLVFTVFSSLCRLSLVVCKVPELGFAVKLKNLLLLLREPRKREDEAVIGCGDSRLRLKFSLEEKMESSLGIFSAKYPS